MDTTHDEPDSTAFRVIEKDPQWTDNTCRMHSVNSLQNNGYLEIVDGSVTCTGTKISKETSFKVYFNKMGSSGGDALFECIDGKSKGWMLCVNGQMQLSARKRTKNYINFADAEDDVLFTVVTPNSPCSQFQIKWKKGGQYIGIDTNGQPIPFDKVNNSGNETLFTYVNI